MSIQEQRKIAKDFTVKHKNKTYQILTGQKVIVLTRNSVTIETRLDGSVRLKYKDVYLKYIDITDNIRLKQYYFEEQIEEVKTMNRKEVSNVKSLHPWRKSNSLFFKKRKF